MSGPRKYPAECLAPGEAHGELTVLTEPLSLWGGFDLGSGRVRDVHHPQCGAVIAGRILAMPGGRGSSSSSSILLEAARLGVHPCAIVLAEPDPILVIGALVAADLYGVLMPVITLDGHDLAGLETGARARVFAASGGAFLGLE